MKKIKNVLLVALFFITAAVVGQTKITGIVVDEMGEPLPGANVVVKGTTNGIGTDFNGKFTLNSKSNSGVVEVSFVGYDTKNVSFTSAKTNLGQIQLQPSNVLGEVVITGVIDIAKDRQTPVASSTIRAEEIQEKLGSQEFPEILKSTPSVYATKQGGGFGDSRLSIRGFDQENVAVLINGVPVNDMENGRVYWSNWMGLSDVTSAMQVQRGLGSSKLANASVGGTVNIVTKTSQQREGGNVGFSYGNDNYMKYRASYSTGKLESGLSASILLSRTQQDGYVDGTKAVGHNYFIGLGYAVNDDHQLEFTFTGAPQWHNQRSYAESISTYQKYGVGGEPNIKYNAAWGYLNGEEFSFRRNFYHKPVMSLNHDWTISDASKLSTVVYASWGRGGGTGPIGDVNNIRDFDSRLRDSNGIVRFDDIAKWNAGGSVPDFGADRTSTISDRSNGLTRRASMNSHNWYGAVVNFHNDANENLSWDLGIDVRTYKGIHYRVVNNLLGATGYVDSRDRNNPNRNITEFVDASPSFNPWQNISDQQKIEYYNDGNVRWLGAFGQVEYKNDKISTYLQGGISQQGFQRVDYFNLGAHNGTEQASSFKNLIGGNIKGGLNWNINEAHNVFFNAGFISKQPFFNSVYTSFTNNDINPFLTNEKIINYEVGYGFSHENYAVKLNAYRTSWKDRFLRGRGSVRGNFVQINGVEQVHSGIELETLAKFGKLKIEGMISLGDFEYKGEAIGTEYDQNNDLVQDNITFYLDGAKAGNQAQTTARVGFTYEASESLKFDIDQFYASRLYASISPAAFSSKSTAELGSLQLPGHSLINAGVSYKLKLNDKMKLKFRFNVNNLTNEVYISDSATNIHATSGSTTYRGIDVRNRVYFGFGRTWNTSVRFEF